MVLFSDSSFVYIYRWRWLDDLFVLSYNWKHRTIYWWHRNIFKYFIKQWSIQRKCQFNFIAKHTWIIIFLSTKFRGTLQCSFLLFVFRKAILYTFWFLFNQVKKLVLGVAFSTAESNCSVLFCMLKLACRVSFWIFTFNYYIRLL